MSRIEKLAIRGIRSFDPNEEVKIEFFHPLTLIQGHNGSGKTTIIECLKMASCGSLPPLSTNGKTFICDPKIVKGNEVKASIKLKFLTPRDKEVLIIRNFQLCLKSNKYEFKRLEQLLKSHNSLGELVTINSTCVDIDKQVPLLMHASKAILENVIFCHQEETSWPFSEPGYLKKVFDEIFDTAKYTKALEELKDLTKEYNNKTKEIKQKIELVQKDFEHFKKLNTSIDNYNSKISEINIQLEETKGEIEKTDGEFKQIIEYEQNYNKKLMEIGQMKTRYEEKLIQIENIKNDPYFVDYTNDELTYHNFVKNYNSSTNDLNKRSGILRNNIENLNNELRNIICEINQIESTIVTKNQLLNKFNNDKISIIDDLNILLYGIFDHRMSYEDINKKIYSKEDEVKNKLNIMDDKKKIFDNKLNEKANETEVIRCLIESKQKEIESLSNKKDALIKNLQNFQNSIEKINRININIEEIQLKINKIENSEILKINNQFSAIEIEKHELIIKLESFPDHMKQEKLIYKISKFKEYYERLDQNNKYTNSLINYYSDKYVKTFFSLDEILNYINYMKNEISEQKQIIREQNYLNSHQIEIKETNIAKLNKNISEKISFKETLLSFILHLYNKFNICVDSENFGINDLNKLILIRNDLNDLSKNLKNEMNSSKMEISFLKEYIVSLNEIKQCVLCNHDLSLNEVNKIKMNLIEKIKFLETKFENISSEVKIKESKLIEINQCEEQINQLKIEINDIANLEIEKDVINKELILLHNKRKNYENSSKEKNMFLMSFEDVKTEEIYKIKNENSDIIKEISILRNDLKINENNNIEEYINKINEYDILKKRLFNLDLRIQEYQNSKSQIYEQLNKYYADLRYCENERLNLTRLSNNMEINDKILEIEKDILSKENEKSLLLLENEKICQLRDSLIIKKGEFDNIYNEKYPKNKLLLEKINIFKIKIQCTIEDFNHYNLNNFSNDHQNYLIEKNIKEQKKSQIEKEIIINQEEYNTIENENKKKLQIENIFKNNILIYNLKKEIAGLKIELDNNDEKQKNIQKIIETKNKIMEKLRLLNTKYHINIGKLSELNNGLIKLNNDVKNDLFYDIENKYNKFKMEYILSIEVTKNIDNYYEALDYSLLKYHSKRMEEINKLINYYWNMTYKGTDIKWIEIRSDVEKTSARSRSYNYRIVFGTNDDGELDMRGRCSAGQKVLASIIIRLALAETFCNNCGILCLDEPTTNLDENHIKSLAKALREIISSRSEDSNFQLVVITHDPIFVDLIGSDFCNSFWEVRKNERNFSTVQLKPINSIFNN